MKKCVNILLTYPDGNIYVVRKVKYDEIKKHNIKIEDIKNLEPTNKYQKLKLRKPFTLEDVKGRGFCSFVVSNCFSNMWSTCCDL